MAEARGTWRWKKHMRISVRGEVFPSAHEVAERFGLKVNSVYWMVHRGKADSIGLGKGKHENHRSPKSRPVILGNRVYPSAKQAHQATGIPYKRLLRYIKGEINDPGKPSKRWKKK